MTRTGDWIQTYTGRQFWPLDPRADEIFVEDIAHALSMQCRFAGHCLKFYSVAEHSVLVSRNVAPELALWALLHDAAEAYLVDLPRPVKRSMPDYRGAEDRVMAAICYRFGLPQDMPAAVKTADNRILADEAEQNMARPPVAWEDNGARLGVRLQFWTPQEAEGAFLRAYAMAAGPCDEPRLRDAVAEYFHKGWTIDRERAIFKAAGLKK